MKNITLFGKKVSNSIKKESDIELIKGYLHKKTMTCQNVSSEKQVRKKIMFCFQDIQVFVFLTIT